jgi:hypothetical protein
MTVAAEIVYFIMGQALTHPVAYMGRSEQPNKLSALVSNRKGPEAGFAVG